MSYEQGFFPKLQFWNALFLPLRTALAVGLWGCWRRAVCRAPVTCVALRRDEGVPKVLHNLNTRVKVCSWKDCIYMAKRELDFHKVCAGGRREARLCFLLPPPPQGCIGRGGAPPPGRPAYAQPLSAGRQVPASIAFITGSNRPQPL